VRSGTTSIERCISRLTSRDARRAKRGTRPAASRTRPTPMVLPPSGRALRLFAGAMPHCVLQVRVLGLGPRSRPRIYRLRALLWAGRSHSTSATSFQSTTHEHDSTSVVLARGRGLPCARCRTRCAFHAARAFLFRCKEGSSSMRHSELRAFPRRSASRAEPRRPESLRPHERHLSSGPAGHGMRAGRKS
jgi:hypothetical protein